MNRAELTLLPERFASDECAEAVMKVMMQMAESKRKAKAAKKQQSKL